VVGGGRRGARKVKRRGEEWTHGEEVRKDAGGEQGVKGMRVNAGGNVTVSLFCPLFCCATAATQVYNKDKTKIWLCPYSCCTLIILLFTTGIRTKQRSGCVLTSSDV
jgi:hypothetical protein